MIQKVTVSILIVLLIIVGGLGFYSYSLNRQVGSLSEQLAVFREEQAGRVSALSGELDTLGSEVAAFRGETLTRVGSLEGEVGKVKTAVDSIGDQVNKALPRIDAVEDKVDTTLARVDSLGNEIKGVTDLSQSVIDPARVFQQVNPATVIISNGQRTIGAGFLYDADAHVVTAQHVIENLPDIFVVFPDGKSITAEVAGSCAISDVAVLKLDSKPDVPPLPMADSSKIKIGEPVVVIGNPFNLPHTLTSGIVSSANRTADIEYDSQSRLVPNLIQFDAAVNFGNSGGPLFNARGEVLGLVIARIGPDEGDGINYAVSANKVKRVAAALIKSGSFDYPSLGVTVTNLTPQTVQNRHLTSSHGVLVTGFTPDSPAQAAGMRADDIILAIDGVAIKDVSGLTSYLGEYKSPGDSATISLIRGSGTLELTVRLGKRS